MGWSRAVGWNREWDEAERAVTFSSLVRMGKNDAQKGTKGSWVSFCLCSLKPLHIQSQ